MKESIDVFDYAGKITKTLPEGILLNTRGEKFNSMVIGWGHLGVIWGLPTFTVYVRQSRYTREQLDKTGEFTVSVPLFLSTIRTFFVLDPVVKAGNVARLFTLSAYVPSSAYSKTNTFADRVVYP